MNSLRYKFMRPWRNGRKLEHRFTVTGLWDYRVQRSKDKLCDKPLPPGNSGVPFLGETVPFAADGRHYFRSRIQKHGQVFRSHLMGEPYIVVCGARHVHKILTSEGDLVANNPAPAACALLGEGSLAKTSGKRHDIQYDTIRWAFNHKTLSAYNERIAQMLHERISDWCREGRVLGVPECEKMILEIGTEVVLGMRFGEEDAKKMLHEFEVFSRNFFTSFTYNLPGTAYRRALKARKCMIKIMQANDVSESCVLNILSSKDRANDGIKNNPDTYDNALEIIFAMTSTTASACCALITLLNDRHDVITGVRNEVAAHCRDEQVPNYRHFGFAKMAGSMTYTNAVAKEVLRLRPPVTGGFRKALKTFELDGYQIPKGWAILYCITDTHENAPNYNPELTPEDWLSRSDRASSTNLHGEKQADDVINSCPVNDDITDFGDAVSANVSAQYQYIPFGAGIRACPGQEFVNQLLRLCLVELCMSTVWELENPNYKIKQAAFPFADDNMPLKIKRREP